jgi:hypothetical protein
VRILALLFVFGCGRASPPRDLDLTHLQEQVDDLRERVTAAVDDVATARNDAQRGAAVGRLWELQRELADVGELVAAARKDRLQPRP